MYRTSRSPDEPIKKAQMDAYLRWVNGQLRKKGFDLVEDLEGDMQDGVHLAQLIEVIAGVKLPINPIPKGAEDKEANIKLILKFMKEHHVRMHTIHASDIVMGQSKAIMRLILALAAHYKPSSVKQSSHSPSLAGLAQGAAATLANVRYEMSSQSPRSHHYSSRSPTEPADDSASPTANQFSPSNTSLASWTKPSKYPGGEDSDMLPTANASVIMQDVSETKTALMDLQQLLLLGLQDQYEVDASVGSDEGRNSLEEELALLRSQLARLEEAFQHSSTELSDHRRQALQLQGVKNGLQTRLAEQENSLLVIKAELLRAGFVQQSLEAAKAELEKKLAERDSRVIELERQLSEQRKELDSRERMVIYKQTTGQLSDKRRESSNHQLRTQISELQSQLHWAAETESALSARLAAQDRRLARLEGRCLNDRTAHSLQSDEATAVHNALQGIRKQLRNHASVDELEKAIGLFTNQPEQGTRSMGNTNTGSNHAGSGATKLLYFTEKNVTPCMVTIRKKLEDITLRDVKTAVDRGAHYRYFFKSQDPEFGAVKEEISADYESVPGWEGKVVAYLEEEH